MLFWLMGDLEDARLLLPAAVLLLLILVWSVLHARQLNLLARGEGFAQLLGVPVLRLRLLTLCAASLATAAAVTVAGTIGFIGLVVPHAIRLLVGNDQRILLPASALVGGAALVLADLAARAVVAPTQLPVGVITALVGVPVFLWLLSRSKA
jgi:iron complex transport system permease protein